jgi:PTH1 family peptidyl-tRNA hydrolase
MSKYLVVGLGNIGSEYANTRHNIGFDVVNAFVKKHGGSFRSDKLAYVAEVKVKGKPVVCICPTQYMNQSGRPFLYWMNKEKVPLEHTLTIVDDVALPLDKVRLRKSGSSGGHNGLKDIEAVLGTTEYPKLRFGIGDHYPRGMQADFVLGRWLRSEEPLVGAKVAVCVEIIESVISGGIDQAMTEYNKISVKA